MFLMIGQPNGPLQPKKKKKPIKTFVLQDSSQIIKLINMNHNKYLNSCSNLSKNGDEQR
jgi:hypothetical protein